MNERARRFFSRSGMRSALVAQLLLVLAAPAFAQQDESSLDALWNENPDQSKSAQSKPSSSPKTKNSNTSIDTSPNFKVTTGGASDAGSTKQPVDFTTTSDSTEPAVSAPSGGSAPLCNIDTFKSSDFVRSGGWPGIGPFNATLRTANEMKDGQDNHLMLKVENQKVTEAELCLVKQPSSPSNFINIEMTTDYFLEALGVKPGKISDFNRELEKNKADVVKDEVKSLSLPAGKYQVSIAAPSEDDLTSLPPDKKEKIALVIKVSSRDASSNAIKEHSAQAVDPVPDQVEEPPPTKVAVATPVRTPPAVKPPVKAPVKTPAAPTQATQQSSDPLKNQFVELLRNWQTIKKTAVRNRATGELSEVLSGEALKKQTGAIKYLMSQHKYYEMTSKGVNVSKIQELTPGKKYACFAQVKEYRRFIDDTTGQVLKEGEDTYNVNYTIEKIDDKYFISDSAVINSAAPAKTR